MSLFVDFNRFCEGVGRLSRILSFHFSYSKPSLSKEIEKKNVKANLILVKKVRCERGGSEYHFYAYCISERCSYF